MLHTRNKVCHLDLVIAVIHLVIAVIRLAKKVIYAPSTVK